MKPAGGDDVHAAAPVASPKKKQKRNMNMSPVSQLPSPWVAIEGDSGVFYYNEETGDSQCEYPFADEAGPEVGAAPCRNTASDSCRDNG